MTWDALVMVIVMMVMFIDGDGGIGDSGCDDDGLVF